MEAASRPDLCRPIQLNLSGQSEIHVSIITDEKSRLATEKDLIEQWKPVCNTQFGLISEEVAEANPDLVVRDGKGEVCTVHYEAANATLLSEFLKEQRKVQDQDATIAQLKKDFQSTIARQQKQIEALTAGFQKVREQLAAASPSEGRLEASKFATGRIRSGGPAPEWSTIR